MDDFLRHAIAYVRERAGATSDEAYAMVHLGAELFAVASLLAQREADPSLRTAWPDPDLPLEIDSLSKLKEELSSLPDHLSARELYERLGEALSWIDSEVFWARDSDSLPKLTELPGIHLGEHLLEGTVFHWARPRPLLRTERYRRLDERGRPLPEPVDDPEQHLRWVGMYWQRQKGTVPRFAPPWSDGLTALSTPLLGSSGKDGLASGFRIALCPLAGGFRPQFEVLSPSWKPASAGSPS